jgi:hypothetical protein
LRKSAPGAWLLSMTQASNTAFSATPIKRFPS